MLNAHEFRRAAKQRGGVDRRLFMAYTAGLAALPTLAARTSAAGPTTNKIANNPFKLGVASGDPTAHRVVLWTRLAPEPLDLSGGMTTETVAVDWELADDDKFTRVVKKGTALAAPQLGHSVHVEVEGLKPDRWYHYRFRAAGHESPVGRTRTMPDLTATPERLRFAFVSCQHYESGYYTGYQHMAGQNLDLMVHLGDYIYEGPGKDGNIRKHEGKEIRSLADYRRRHAQYRSDELLHGMHAECPWMVTWDDHEFDNNYAAEISEEAGVDPVDFLIRRANSYQAYYEAMPLSRRSMPRGADMRLYRKLTFGNLAQMLVLDTRQYRSNQPNDDKKHDLNDAAWDKHQSILGTAQRGWVEQSLITSPSSWNVMAQQVMMGVVDFDNGAAQGYSMDQWPGYMYERNALMEFVGSRSITNPVVLTGDIHSNWVNNLRTDDTKPETPVVATEFVGTSMSSGGNGDQATDYNQKLKSENPGLVFHNAERGYVLCEVTPKEWTSHYMVVDDITRPGGKVTTRASFVVENGKPGTMAV